MTLSVFCEQEFELFLEEFFGERTFVSPRISICCCISSGCLFLVPCSSSLVPRPLLFLIPCSLFIDRRYAFFVRRLERTSTNEPQRMYTRGRTGAASKVQTVLFPLGVVLGSRRQILRQYNNIIETFCSLHSTALESEIQCSVFGSKSYSVWQEILVLQGVMPFSFMLSSMQVCYPRQVRSSAPTDGRRTSAPTGVRYAFFVRRLERTPSIIKH